jgi:hypothetical protein
MLELLLGEIAMSLSLTSALHGVKYAGVTEPL